MLYVVWLLFMVIFFLIILMFGQDMVFVMLCMLFGGMCVGFVIVVGVSVGLFVYMMFVMFGLGVFFQVFEWLFMVLKMVGVLYLLYFGIMLLCLMGELMFVGYGNVLVLWLWMFV